MKTLIFKTDFACNNCVKSAQSILKKYDIESWEVDLKHADKLLNIKSKYAPDDILALFSEYSHFKLELVSVNA